MTQPYDITLLELAVYSQMPVMSADRPGRYTMRNGHDVDIHRVYHNGLAESLNYPNVVFSNGYCIDWRTNRQIVEQQIVARSHDDLQWCWAMIQSMLPMFSEKEKAELVREISGKVTAPATSPQSAQSSPPQSL